METRTITVKGAREHNLRDVSVTLPRDKLICFTGVSGSGKSSFAFDTLYAEGQRRYIESLSTYARQFMGQLPKPDVDLITGLSPSVSIQQQTGGWNPRSTVGTVTQILDFLRVLYARVGRQHCYRCGAPITAQTRARIVDRIAARYARTLLAILAPVARGQKGAFADLFEAMIKRGFTRARVDGRIVRLDDDLRLDKNIRHHIEIVVDRLTVTPTNRSRLIEAVESALELGDGALIGCPIEGDNTTGDDWLLSSRYACPTCDISFAAPSPQLFSFNSPSGMCPECDGLGVRFDFDPELLVPNPRRSFLNLAIEPMRTRIGRWRRHIYRGVARTVGVDLKTPWRDLPPKAQRALLYGTGDTHITFEWRSRGRRFKHGGTFDGVIAELRDKYRRARAPMVRAYYEKYMRKTVCPRCLGARLCPQARAMTVGGLALHELTGMTIADAATFLSQLKLSEMEHHIAEQVLKEVRARLGFLTDVGLEYLTLDRAAPTLSGGEAQRIRLASQVGAGLVGVLYILDEPSIGLHARDNHRLLKTLCRLRDQGNTVVVVEHDEATMRAADLLVDFGPGPGVRGGKIVAAGTFDQVAKAKQSITSDYLTGRQQIEIPKVRRPITNPPTADSTAPPARTNTPRKSQTPKNAQHRTKTERRKPRKSAAKQNTAKCRQTSRRTPREKAAK